MLFRLISLFTLCLVFTFHTPIHASPKNEGKVIYHISYNHSEIYKLLKVTEKQYNENWHRGMTLIEIGKENGVSYREVEGYFYSFHYQEMEKWRKKGDLNEEDYFDLVYRLKDDIHKMITENPNKRKRKDA